MWAMSVLGNTKSNCHRKTHGVEPDGTGRMFMHLTWGGLPREIEGGVSRGHSSAEAIRKDGGAKGQRTRTCDQPNSSGIRGKQLIETAGRNNYGSHPDWRNWKGRWIASYEGSARSESDVRGGKDRDDA